jgi:outer membrane lipoprotein-sorting protein
MTAPFPPRLQRFLGAALTAVLFATSAPPPALSSEAETAPQAASLAESDTETVARVERYLTGIETLHARFLQTSSNGATAEGEVWVDRPGRLRFEYDPPHPALLVSNGTLLVYLDRELDQASYVPVSETPLWFLIRERVDLDEADSYRLAGVERGPASLRIHIAQPGSAPGEPGSLTLVFQDSPLQLRKWRIVDQQGITTNVALLNPEFDVNVDGDRFDFGKLDLPETGKPADRGR